MEKLLQQGACSLPDSGIHPVVELRRADNKRADQAQVRQTRGDGNLRVDQPL